jgi:hypothetical protein
VALVLAVSFRAGAEAPPPMPALVPQVHGNDDDDAVAVASEVQVSFDVLGVLGCARTAVVVIDGDDLSAVLVVLVLAVLVPAVAVKVEVGLAVLAGTGTSLAAPDPMPVLELEVHANDDEDADDNAVAVASEVQVSFRAVLAGGGTFFTGHESSAVLAFGATDDAVGRVVSDEPNKFLFRDAAIELKNLSNILLACSLDSKPVSLLGRVESGELTLKVSFSWRSSIFLMLL